MNIAVIPCGTLKVPADEMHRGLSPERIREHYPVDTGGCMRIAMNALLVSEGPRRVLFDPGCGDFLPGRLLRQYDLRCGVPLEDALEKLGTGADQITDVVFTHLHFDHCSGAFIRRPGYLGKRFPRARYHVLEAHYRYASRPDRKEEGAFAAGLFRYVDRIHWLEEFRESWVEWKVFDGHTRQMAVPGIRTVRGVTWYLSDLAPMESFLRPEVSSHYDLEPELARQEKTEFLSEIAPGSEIVFFHDPLIESKIIS